MFAVAVLSSWFILDGCVLFLASGVGDGEAGGEGDSSSESGSIGRGGGIGPGSSSW